MDSKQSITRVRRLGPRYPKQVAQLRVGIGIWLCVLAAIFYSQGDAGQWPSLLVATAGLHFVLAYRLFRIARTDPHRRMRLQ
jgi:hypothetical protein